MDSYGKDDFTNISDNIKGKLYSNLHKQKGHPLNTIKEKIESFFQSKDNSISIYDDFLPIVTTEENFDDLLIPIDHPGRSLNDTYYLNASYLLRTHTSAHQSTLFRKGDKSFLVTGDVYRRDTIDKTHYPIFHQMEGVRLYSESHQNEWIRKSNSNNANIVLLIQDDMKAALEGMVRNIFGDVKVRWVDAYFPFTQPSLEMEIFFNDEWLEVLGCGVVHENILKNCGRGSERGWAFGLGLERLAMVLFQIPDIRLFWTKDQRFLSQFKSGEIVKFIPYSKYPSTFRDVSFWASKNFHDHGFYELLRDETKHEDIVEEVKLVDEFVHPKTSKISKCFRIHYRSMDRSLTSEEVNLLQEKIRTALVTKFAVDLR